MQSALLPYSGIDVQHPFEKGHNILFRRSDEEVEFVLTQKIAVPRYTVSRSTIHSKLDTVSYLVHFFTTFQIFSLVESS